jgi:streptogramin lyase
MTEQPQAAMRVTVEDLASGDVETHLLGAGHEPYVIVCGPDRRVYQTVEYMKSGKVQLWITPV